jgi:ribonuclease G
MGSKLVFIRHENKIISGLIDGNDLVEVQAEDAEKSSLLGNIYLGKVQNIVKNINAAFVEIENRQVVYLSLTDMKNPVFADSSHPGKLRVGDELLVQVTKENTKLKAPLASTEFDLTGKYVVLVHGRKSLGISQKISDPEERKRLKELIKPYLGEDFGFIVRTNAASAPDAVLEQEVARLVRDYKNIVGFGVHWNCFSKLYSVPPAYIGEIRDSYDDEIDEIKTDDEELYREIRDYLEIFQPEDLPKLVKYDGRELSLAKLYGIEEKIKKALYEKVWLDSGAFLVIQPTEACTVIDVNTGKAISGKTDTEGTFFSVNIEASEEIARQIRLRNLSGIIIVDFIDMESEVHKKKLMRHLSEMLEKDRIPTKVIDMTALNLVEITRKKIRKPLAEQMKQ